MILFKDFFGEERAIHTNIRIPSDALLGEISRTVTVREDVSGNNPLLEETHPISSFSRAVGERPWTSAVLKHFAILSASMGEGPAKASLDNSGPQLYLFSC